MPGLSVPPGGNVVASLRGTFGAITRTTSIFRDALDTQLVMQGFRVLSIEIESDWGYPERGYTATVTIAPLASMTTDRVVAAIRAAANTAGGYMPTVTLTSHGEAAQAPTSSTVGGLAGSVLDAANGIVQGVGGLGRGVGAAATNVADVTKDLKTVLIVASIGLVVIVGFVAFGPNTGAVARAAARR